MSLYDVLGITPEEKRLQGKDFENIVKRQYKALAVQFHPDKFQDTNEKKTAEDKFKKIAEAKDVLSDTQKRLQYDMTGSTSGFNYSNFNMHADLDDVLQSFFNGRGFGFQQQYRQGPQQYKGEDAIIRITLDIKDVYRGTEKKYKYRRKVVCKNCDGGNLQNCNTCGGTGMATTSQRMGNMFFQQSVPCQNCGGIGKIKSNSTNCRHCNGIGLEEKEEIVIVQIPRGVTKDVVLVNKNMGHELPKAYNGTNGDLKIIIGNINSGDYQVDGYNLVTHLDIPILDIITGTTVEILSPMGDKIKIDVPKNTPLNHSIRYTGKGIPVANQNRNGDMYVIFKYKFPNSLDKSDLKKIEELKLSKSFR
jgi:molecular chaperone DnaJ